MALTEIYVDPAIAANSGTGTSGDPYGDLQYALNRQPLQHQGGNGGNSRGRAGTHHLRHTNNGRAPGHSGLYQYSR